MFHTVFGWYGLALILQFFRIAEGDSSHDALRIPWTAGDSRKAIGLQQNKFEAWQNEFTMSWPPLITGGGITLSKPVCFTVFHSRCFTHGVSWLPLKPDGIGMCECSADRDWRTALDWNSQHCPVSSHGWPTIQWCNWQIQRRSATVAMDHQKLPGEYPLLNKALENFHVSSKLPIWWVRLPPQRVYSDQIQDRPRTGSPNVDPQPCLTETLRRGRQSNHGVLRFPGYSFGIWDGAGYGLVGVARIGYGSIAINTMLKGIRYL